MIDGNLAVKADAIPAAEACEGTTCQWLGCWRGRRDRRGAVYARAGARVGARRLCLGAVRPGPGERGRVGGVAPRRSRAQCARACRAAPRGWERSEDRLVRDARRGGVADRPRDQRVPSRRQDRIRERALGVAVTARGRLGVRISLVTGDSCDARRRLQAALRWRCDGEVRIRALSYPAQPSTLRRSPALRRQLPEADARRHQAEVALLVERANPVRPVRMRRLRSDACSTEIRYVCTQRCRSRTVRRSLPPPSPLRCVLPSWRSSCPISPAPLHIGARPRRSQANRANFSCLFPEATAAWEEDMRDSAFWTEGVLRISEPMRIGKHEWRLVLYRSTSLHYVGA